MTELDGKKEEQPCQKVYIFPQKDYHKGVYLLWTDGHKVLAEGCFKKKSEVLVSYLVAKETVP